MMARSVNVALSLLALANRSFALSCVGPSDEFDCGDPPTCSYGLTTDACGHCSACFKGPDEKCGGPWNIIGICAEGLKCELDQTFPDLNDFNKDGICEKNVQSEWTWAPETNACILDNNNLVLESISFEFCKFLCQVQIDFDCRSLEYHSNDRRCVLSEATSTSSNYSQPCYVMGWTFTEVIEWKWAPETNDCIVDNNNLVLESISLDDCKAHCQVQIDFDCRSLEYNTNDRRCVLSEATSTSINHRQPCHITGWTFTEVIVWTWSPETNACIVDNNNLVLESISLAECKTRCKVQNEFDCRSLEYRSNDSRCILSEATRTFNNYRQPCHIMGWIFTEVIEWTWAPKTNACIVGNNNLVVESISLGECKTRCQVQNDFDCQSIEYHTNDRRCVLSEATSNSIDYRQPCYITGWTFTEVIG
ncbi:unnamed protein product [Meganyctiphanes norvegica]|uniref:Apple domain-containing protein n=1 Tax=Meganyctiphanes norvegica TaxID=48144 RepID=A0AAV2Q5F5_MEGNR